MEFEFPSAGSLYGLIAEFEKPDEICEAAKATFAAGFRRIDAYSPYPVHGLSEAIGFERSRMSMVVLIGGLIGMAGGYLLQWWASAVAYPLNIGGRPLNSLPAFIPITFECTILAAALSAVIGMFFLNDLPMPYHPVFNVERFAFASKDRFFLLIEARDPKFNQAETRRFLEGLGPKGVYEVPT